MNTANTSGLLAGTVQAIGYTDGEFLPAAVKGKGNESIENVDCGLIVGSGCFRRSIQSWADPASKTRGFRTMVRFGYY